jgi:hypothetical protein
MDVGQGLRGGRRRRGGASDRGPGAQPTEETQATGHDWGERGGTGAGTGAGASGGVGTGAGGLGQALQGHARRGAPPAPTGKVRAGGDILILYTIIKSWLICDRLVLEWACAMLLGS